MKCQPPHWDDVLNAENAVFWIIAQDLLLSDMQARVFNSGYSNKVNERCYCFVCLDKKSDRMS